MDRHNLQVALLLPLPLPPTPPLPLPLPLPLPVAHFNPDPLRGLQVVLVRHAEDISWSDSFASVRTVYDKQGMELPALPRTRVSTGAGPAAPQAESVALPNVGKEQHAYLTHIVPPAC